jgi:beta-phosphoglucomutase-like phosphatase (HAD superfamily)
MIEAVVFDCDGVLIDSEPVWEEVRREFVASRGGRWLPDTQDRMMGMSTGEWSAYIAADLTVGMSPQEVATAVIGAMAARYAEHLPLIAGAVEAVTALAGQWPLAMASSAPQSLIEVVLDASGLRSSFRVALSSELVPQAGPRRLPGGGAATGARPGQVRGDRGLLQRPALGGGRWPDGHRGTPSEVPARPRRPRRRAARAG